MERVTYSDKEGGTCPHNTDVRLISHLKEKTNVLAVLLTKDGTDFFPSDCF